jgi:predicted SAM-dependent methyltransferase
MQTVIAIDRPRAESRDRHSKFRVPWSLDVGMESVRINLGGADSNPPGWINYDRSRAVLLARFKLVKRLVWVAHRAGLASKQQLLDWPTHTRVRDLAKGIPHEDASVDAIFSSHMLEHVTPEDALFILSECYRVLKPGGTLRVVVPDLKRVTRRYLDGDLRTQKEPLGDSYMRHLLEHRPAPKGRLPERLVRRLLRTEDGGHKWMYDTESLIARCRQAGFEDVQQVAFREGRDAETAQLDSRLPQDVHVEAIR